MPEQYTFNSIAQTHQVLGLPKPKHPLVSVIRDAAVQQDPDLQGDRIVINLYQIIFKKMGCGSLQYGKNAYDYEEGTLIFTAPGQVLRYEGETEATAVDTEGWRMAFHPDLIRQSDLGANISRYSFFEYDVNEALHLSDDERGTIEDLLEKITKEYSQNLDRHSQHLIISNIQLLLDYCLRFYDRQFYTRSNFNSDIVSRFERLLKTYYQTERFIELGIPSVNYCAQEMNLSPNYLSDLLKKETGKTTREHIHLFIIEKAKADLLHTSHSVSEIGYALGFEYPQHFSNLFKAKTGMSPRTFRNMN